MLTRDQKQQGTSPEVIAPYVPYGITVQTPDYTGELCGLLKNHISGRFIAQVMIGKTWNGYSLKDCLPVLRPFSQLVEPLADGTIPAELLFEIAFEYNYTAGLPIGVPNPAYAECAFTAQIMAGGMLSVKRFGFGDCELRIYPDWQFTRMVDGIARWAHHPAAMIDKLRSWHFALPVNGRPLIEGVDYIAAAPASAPLVDTEKGPN